MWHAKLHRKKSSKDNPNQLKKSVISPDMTNEAFAWSWSMTSSNPTCSLGYNIKLSSLGNILTAYFTCSGRAGSEVDLKSVVKCFTSLKFEVIVRKNLRYNDLVNVLEDVANAVDHSRSDCFVMFLLSHGNLGTIYAYDQPYPTGRLRLENSSNH